MAPSVFLPALVYEIGNGAIAPVIALTALDLGASVTTAGFMLALLGVGQVIGDVPASWLADRIGDRRAMTVAAALSIIAVVTCASAPSRWVLGIALLVIGASNSAFYLARQSYVSEVAPIRLRARALSTLAGAHRVGLFIGPFVGAVAISIGGIRSAYVVAAVASAVAALLLFVIPDADRDAERPPPVRGTASAASMLRDHRRLFATLGLAVLAVGATRAARQTVLPLWADHIGLTPEHTSVVFGLASAVEMTMFYPSGKVMDHFGRLWAALPAMLLLGASMVLLPLTASALPFTLVAMSMGLGNGIGSGIMMTLGAGAAPAVNRTRFLSVWRVFSDSGQAAGPVVVAVVAGAVSLAAGIVSVGIVGLLAAAGLATWAPRYSRFATPRAVARSRATSDT